MEIVITDHTYVKEFQREFQKGFPYLKLEFFRNALKNENHTMISPPVSGDVLMHEIRRKKFSGSLDINGNRRVIEVEAELENTFGLLAQVFRKSGSLWIETTLTGHWSLSRQNSEGRQMS